MKYTQRYNKEWTGIWKRLDEIERTLNRFIKRRQKQYTQRYNKQWIEPKQRGFGWQCCNCGDTHKLDFRIIKNKPQIRAYK